MSVNGSEIPQVPRLGLIGPGALGTFLAARLTLAGYPCLLFDYRPERAESLNARPLHLIDDAGEHEVPVPVTDDFSRLAEVDIAIVAVKAYNTEEVARNLVAHLRPDAFAVTVQNGLGNVEILVLALSEERVVGGTTTQGVLQEEPGQVRDTGSGSFVLGQPNGLASGRAEDAARVLVSAGFAVSVSENLNLALWDKAILNTAINPVAALTRLHNGDLAAHDPSLELMTAAAREAFSVARRNGINLPQQDWRTRLQTICQATAPNINSMLQDVLLSRWTEIDALNGAIVRAAEKYGQPVPVNRTLWSLVTMIHLSYEQRLIVTRR